LEVRAEQGLPLTIETRQVERGIEIAAGCGQLRQTAGRKM